MCRRVCQIQTWDQCVKDSSLSCNTVALCLRKITSRGKIVKKYGF